MGNSLHTGILSGFETQNRPHQNGGISCPPKKDFCPQFVLKERERENEYSEAKHPSQLFISVTLFFQWVFPASVPAIGS